ncbi:ribosome recycling factor [Parenemella sanctibonifatiensis]|uniref:Ribosome-recycling factor n=1 Tax=Parenemella sanctibonifatiensis TaxID=2016505 RepID=A0A255EEH8_9ACTN|nr:ribosome recycling factor [Parenemella sanctibonifatiensis]OYN88362.1 ribosome recycling factor [Parenemella sanctibonifatiensis]OYN89958.1 ribosome recycling factor [Parenemella sanctibonifatiensis]
MKDAKAKMSQAVDFAREEFAAIRTGRAHPGMFNKITADYYGAQTPLQQLATFQAPEARMMLITPFDKSSVNAIEKAIRESDLGVNPSNDGNSIRVVLPELTEERRKEYVKVAKTKAEEARVSIRGARRTAKEALDKLVKNKEAGEDEIARVEKQLDAVTKEHTEKVDEALKAKEAELLEV